VRRTPGWGVEEVTPPPCMTLGKKVRALSRQRREEFVSSNWHRKGVGTKEKRCGPRVPEKKGGSARAAVPPEKGKKTEREKIGQVPQLRTREGGEANGSEGRNNSPPDLQDH